MGNTAQMGWVYVVTNKALPSLVKIGFTTRNDINKRLREFDQAGLPYPYEVAYKVWVAEPQKLEKRVHQFLTIQRESKEWFRCSVERAKEAIEHLAPVHKEIIQEQETSPEPNNFSDSGWPGYSEEPNARGNLDSYEEYREGTRKEEPQLDIIGHGIKLLVDWQKEYGERERKRRSQWGLGITILFSFLAVALLLTLSFTAKSVTRPRTAPSSKPLAYPYAAYVCPQEDGLVFHPSSSRIAVCQDGRLRGMLKASSQFEREVGQARRWIMNLPLRSALEIPDFHKGFDTARQGKSFVREKLKSQTLQ